MIAALVLGLLSVLLVAGYRQLALQRGWLDAPNQRSSHIHHTPRGAGIVFVLLISAAACWWGAAATLPAQLTAALLIGLGVAATGWWDDLRGLAAGYRFALYWLFVLAAMMALRLPADLLAIGAIGWLTLIAGSVAALWLLNLYNFMDGINGIAAAEALFVLASALWLANGTPAFDAMALVTAAAAGSIGGFLLWNFPLARVFMGDVGSAYLGFLLGVLIQYSHGAGGPQLLVWLLLLGVFIVDASYTLAVRIITGQAWQQAHRLHAYQILARRWRSHGRVVAALMAVNFCWLLPWATALHHHRIGPITAVLGAWLPLIAVCAGIGAGSQRRTAV